MDFMISASHWGMYPGGYWVCADPFNTGTGTAVFIRTDETGRALDDPMGRWSSSEYNDAARRYMVAKAAS